jgi:hypothetical protein
MAAVEYAMIVALILGIGAGAAAVAPLPEIGRHVNDTFAQLNAALSPAAGVSADPGQ